MSFLEELVKKGVINKSQINEVKNLAKEKHDNNIDEALIEFGIPEEKILTTKGEYLQMPVKKVDTKGMTLDALKYIPEDAATYYHFAPIELKEGVLEVGILDGDNTQAIDALQFISAKLGIPFKIFLISSSDYKNIMESYRGISVQVEEALDQLNQEETLDAKSLSESNTLNKEIKNVKKGEEAKIVEDAPVIKIVAVILRNAIESNASDIHIENTGEKIKDTVLDIISANGLVDVIIPRGSKGLINFVRENATVPVIETGAGVCHTYVDESAKLLESAKIIFNAKTQRPSVCNALDTLLIHKKIMKAFLPKVAKLLVEKDVEIFADTESHRILENIYPKNLLKKAKILDFGREFLSQKMSVKIVSGIDEAIKFISKYSSKHSEAILTENKKKAERFLKEIDAAVVYVNASTRFSDGAVFGLGSEIGVSTDKIHARGPMGPNEMTTYKWIVSGNYNIRK